MIISRSRSLIEQALEHLEELEELKSRNEVRAVCNFFSNDWETVDLEMGILILKGHCLKQPRLQNLREIVLEKTGLELPQNIETQHERLMVKLILKKLNS